MGTVYVDETGVMLFDVAGRAVPMRRFHAAPLAHGKAHYRPNQFILARYLEVIPDNGDSHWAGYGFIAL
ncbi:hypothetical protein QP923_08315 [Corynebacterium sp. MSK151]|uniref:hypothetical protein n=1 Tax=unclassified Corynebacterium TaxID=2624378 RepID=UPI00254DAC06|nr:MULTISPECIES: hypothetical protein [unclassified Corynebacterium]MDK8759596.1 hypothetical protein [Corynebacterium sp. MSK151]MDK8848606.1 hypothetical protein [Corynebacterium sp. MSK047]MDU4705188.1 hypothetical protein [Corynebacterium sp.]